MMAYKVLNVWHVGAWNRNIGDWVMCYQLHRHLNDQAHQHGIHFDFQFLDGQKTLWHPSLVDQLNEEADLLLVGGGGLVFMRPMDESLSGWGFNISQKDLLRIKPPIATYALGNNKFPFENHHFPASTQEHLQNFQKKVSLFSVRTSQTKTDLVEDFGLEANLIEVIPDPGVWLCDRAFPLPQVRDGITGPVIGVNLAGDRPDFRFEKPGLINRQFFVKNLQIALHEFCEAYDGRVLFMPHLNQVDTDLFDEFSSGFNPGRVMSLHREAPYLYFAPGESLYPTVPYFTAAFKHSDLHMGMRFHNGVIAAGAGKKFISLASQSKLMEFIDDNGLPSPAIHMKDLKQDTPDRILRTIVGCLEDGSYEPQLQASLEKQKQTLTQFNAKLIDLVLHSKGTP